MSQTYENLALEGGGVWGIAYAGALEELDRIGVLPGIKRVAGTSAGSITALLLALGYSSAQISTIVSELDYEKFLDQISIERVLTQYGLYDGEFALSLFQGWVAERLGSKEATFQDLKAAGGLDLRVYATDLNTQQAGEFSFENTSDVPLAAAVRASMSVPLVFTAVEIGGHIYIDGGAVFDYPIMGFGKDETARTLGLAFAISPSAASGEDEEAAFGYRQPVEYIRRLVSVVQRVQVPVLDLHASLKDNTILIDTGEINPLDFSIDQKEMASLIDRGRHAVRQHFLSETP